MAFSAAELQSLKEVITGYIFEIPEYQRGYAWQESQWQALWQDLENISKADSKQHFAGMMLLKPKPDEAERVEVVDGQQRLITVITLANKLRQHSSPSGSNANVYRLNFVDNEDLQNFFDFYSMADESKVARLSGGASSYALNIKKCAEYFGKKIDTIPSSDAEHLLKVLLDQFRLFVLKVSDGFDIHVAFETLNNRGRRLSHMELLKNRLIYLTTVLKGDADEAAKLRSDIHSVWKGIYRSLGRSTKTQNHDDEFLLAHATAYFKKRREAEWLDKTLFESTFSITNESLTFAEIGEYITSLEVGAVWWSHIHEPNLLPQKHQMQLARLGRSKFAYFKPLILSAYMRISSKSKIAVSNPLEHEDDLTEVVELLIQIERFVVLVFRLLGYKGDHAKAYMDACAYALLRQGRDGAPEELQTCNFQNASERESISLVSSYIKAWIENTEIDEDTYSDNRFKWSGVFDYNELQKTIERRFREGNGYYKWEFTRLALFEYEEKFCNEGNNPIKERSGWDKFSFDETVEHIYPQSPEGKGREYWKAHIPMDGRANRNGKLSKILQNSIGNLLFLSRSDNSAASCEGYSFVEEKIQKGKRERFRNASYSATDVATNFDRWNVQSIAKRGVTILKFVEQRWNIVLTEKPNDPISYLPLCFGAESENIRNGDAGKKITRSSF